MIYRLLYFLVFSISSTAFVVQRRHRKTSFKAVIAEFDDYKIRDCLYGELSSVTDIIMSSFYNKTSSPWRQLYRMGELNRLQQSFPYAETDHRMLVATCSQTKDIIGFCDIDARKPNRPTSYQFNPRPYLSDLCVHPGYRNRGIAKAIITSCEDFCVQELNHVELFIRVERNNTPALSMYSSLGYDEIDHPDRPEVIVLLRKSLSYDAEVVIEDAMEQFIDNTRKL